MNNLSFKKCIYRVETSPITPKIVVLDSKWAKFRHKIESCLPVYLYNDNVVLICVIESILNVYKNLARLKKNILTTFEHSSL